MIHTAQQLKALVRNRSKGSSEKALILIRNFMMERFLERLSMSRYRNNLVLKGGILISAIVGLDRRSSMDIDTTVTGLSLTEDKVRQIIAEIISIQLQDCVQFKQIHTGPIMDEAEYPGIRVTLDATLESMHTPLKIDFSTGDSITPEAISFFFPLLFEERFISIITYNLETMLAEKMETVFSRGSINTRMRDFYDIYLLESTQLPRVSPETLKSAFKNTCATRNFIFTKSDCDMILNEIQSSPNLIALWQNYQKKNNVVTGLAWEAVMTSLLRFYQMLY